MIPLPTWLSDLSVRLPDEEPELHIVRVLNALNGTSLIKNKQKLQELFLISEPSIAKAQAMAEVKTNCATVMRAIWALCGCTHPLATKAYPGQVAVSWVLQIARECDAIISLKEFPDAWTHIEPGWSMHYGTPGTNNDHVEFALGIPDVETGFCPHGGGGRENNAITIAAPDDIRKSHGRPLLHVIRPDRLFPVVLS